MQVLNSNALHSYSIYCGKTTLYWFPFTDELIITLWQMQQVQLVSPTNFCQKCYTKVSSNKHWNWPCYLYRQTVVFVTVKVYDSELWVTPTSCRREYWVYSFCWTKRALAWRTSALETWTKAIHKHLAASPCVEKYCTSLSAVTKQAVASQTEFKWVGQTIHDINY